MSGFQKSNVLPKVDISAVQQGWALFYPDQTAAIGLWGVSFATNLTSDATGIGHWSEEQFGKALKEGKPKGLDSNRPLLPPMPWPNYIDLHDDDLKAIFAFLKALPPVDNVVPVPLLLADLEGK
ncbi:MAG: hypothetical protein KIT80_07415 [Chitinophagaceae bacterium]|nr:hypothetical protein [Chitinophagaceae bacterium]MCW5926720.1 hypothetical protein [Chitinophagaceae bacterium]